MCGIVCDLSPLPYLNYRYHPLRILLLGSFALPLLLTTDATYAACYIRDSPKWVSQQGDFFAFDDDYIIDSVTNPVTIPPTIPLTIATLKTSLPEGSH